MNIIIVGAGDIGFHLCKKLIEDNNSCTMIEIDPAIAQKTREHLDSHVIEGSATSLKVLQKANIESTDIFIAVTQNDELNLIACLIAKKNGVSTTIARIRNFEYTSMKSSDFGVDMVVHPEKEAAEAVIQLVRQSSATDYFEFENGRIKIIGIRIDNDFEYFDHNLIEISKLIKNIPFRVLAIKRVDKTIIPKGDDVLKRGDQVFIICGNQFLKDTLTFLGKQNTKIDNIMILGGGLIGQYIAAELEKKINIKIIESNERKAYLLAENLSKSLVIHGSGTDIELLMNEDLNEMDEFISVSGDDETNIISSMLAAQMNVKRRITMVKNIDYLKMSNSAAVDSIICKPMITVNAILQFIRRKKHTSYAEIAGLDAVILELQASEHSKIVKKTLADIKIPDNVIFGAILKRNNILEIPTGLSRVEPGDKVVIFYLPGNIKEIEKLF